MQIGLRIALVFLIPTVLLPMGCVTLHVLGGPREPLVESRISGPKSGPKILMVEIQGVIREDERSASLLGRGVEGSVARLKEQLDLARKDTSIKGLLLRVDSPGGSASASDLLHHEITRFKQDRKLPVVAQLMGTAASGGYYAAMAADEIHALHTTVTGSIGVIFIGVSLAGLMDKLGIFDQTITSGPYKDTGSPLTRMTPDQRAHLQSIIDDFYERFVEIVILGRPRLQEARIYELADGRIYSAKQALEAGLVDRLGDVEDSIARVEELAGIVDAQVITYHRESEWRQNVYTQSGASPSLSLDWTSLLGVSPPPPGFHYLWWPLAQR